MVVRIRRQRFIRGKRFFVISGYVITKVLNERYFVIENGFRKFWINRFLRLYPTFLISVLLGLSIAFLAPEQSAALHAGISLPGSDDGQFRMTQAGMAPALTPLIYLMNFSMVGLQSPFLWQSPIAFSPNGWSTNVELYFYLLLSLGVASSYSRARRLLAAGMFFSIAIFVLWGLYKAGVLPGVPRLFGTNSWPIKLFYYSFFGWTILFALGCTIYFLPKLSVPYPVRWSLLAICLFMPFLYTPHPAMWPFARIVYGVVIALTLRCFSDDRGPPFIRFLGDLSYPLFLIHWPLAGYVSWTLGITKNNAQMLLANSAVSLLVAVAIVLLVERPVEKLRKTFKK